MLKGAVNAAALLFPPHSLADKIVCLARPFPRASRHDVSLISLFNQRSTIPYLHFILPSAHLIPAPYSPPPPSPPSPPKVKAAAIPLHSEDKTYRWFSSNKWRGRV